MRSCCSLARRWRLTHQPLQCWHLCPFHRAPNSPTPRRSPTTRTSCRPSLATRPSTECTCGQPAPKSAFATLPLRTKATKGHRSKPAALAMAFKLIQSAHRRWRMLNAAHLVALVRAARVAYPGPSQRGGRQTSPCHRAAARRSSWSYQHVPEWDYKAAEVVCLLAKRPHAQSWRLPGPQARPGTPLLTGAVGRGPLLSSVGSKSCQVSAKMLLRCRPESSYLSVGGPLECRLSTLSRNTRASRANTEAYRCTCG